jgi:membrane carboxypeptidase/penicillin-binding protein
MTSNRLDPVPKRVSESGRSSQALLSAPGGDWRGGFLRGVLIALIGAVLFACVGAALALGAYVYVARQLPSPDELLIRAKTFESTRVYDRNGVLLWEIMDPTGGRRTVVRLQSVPLLVRQATIATEDPTFYSNPGVNPLSIW